VVNFFGWAVIALIILTFITPFLLNKKGGPLAPNYYPIVLWISSNLLFLSGAATRRLWGVVGFGLAANSVVTAFAFLRASVRNP
jgi:hypothetical protein